MTSGIDLISSVVLIAIVMPYVVVTFICMIVIDFPWGRFATERRLPASAPPTGSPCRTGRG